MADSSGFTEYGLVSSVVYQQWGSELVAAAPIGATTLTVDSTVDFDDAGGTLDLNGTHLEYTATDEDAGTITLAGALVTAAAEGDFVGVVESGSVKVDYLAQVSMGEGEDVEVEIAVEDRDLWPEGQYDVEVPVVVSPDLAALKLAPGQVPLRDASYLDPTTIPETIPTVPPDTPVLSVKPLTRGFVVSVTNPKPGVDYEFVVEVDGGELHYPAERASTRYLTNTPTGAPLDGAAWQQVSSPTSWFVTAHNAAGSTDSATVEGTPLAQEDSTTIAELSVDLLTSGDFNAAMAILGAMSVGPITIDPTNGILAPLPNGGVFHIPIDGSPARFDGEFIARSLNVEGNALLKGLTQVLGTVRVAGKMADPIVAPGVYASWSRLTLETIPLVPYSAARGLCERIGLSTQWVIARTFIGNGDIRCITKSTGLIDPFVAPSFGDFYPDGGITAVGGNYYLLGRDYTGGRGGAWWVYKLNSSFTKTAEFALDTADTSVMTLTPTIGNDGTDLIVAWARTTSTYSARVYTTAGVGGTTTTLTHNLGAKTNLAGVYKGSADFGAARYVVSRFNADPLVFNTSGVRQTGEEFPRANNSEARGFVWDGTRFHHLDPAGYVWDYATAPTSTTYDVAYEFASQSGLRTLPSPTRTFVCPRRARLAFDCPPPPETGTPGTIADRVQFLAANSTGGTLRVQVSPAAGVTSGSIETYNGAGTTASATNTFPSSGIVGIIESTGANWRWKGDGTAIIGTWSLSAAGAVTAGTGTVGTGTFRDSVDARVTTLAVIETTTSLSASGNYSGTVKATKHGTSVFLSGGITRATSFSTTFEDTGMTLPVGMRPSATIVLRASQPWNSTVQYQFQVLSTGVIQIRMSAANSNTLSLDAAITTL